MHINYLSNTYPSNTYQLPIKYLQYASTRQLHNYQPLSINYDFNFISDQTLAMEARSASRRRPYFFSFCLLNGLYTILQQTNILYYGRDALQLQYSVDAKRLSKSQALTLAMGFPLSSLLNIIMCAIDQNRISESEIISTHSTYIIYISFRQQVSLIIKLFLFFYFFFS